VFKRFFSKRHIAVLLVILSILVYFLSSGIQDYFSTIKSTQDLSSLENVMYNSMHNYEQYSFVGVRMALIPTPACSFFTHSSVFKNLNARFNTSYQLKIETDLPSKSISPSKFSVPIDFSRFILIFLTLLALYYGREPPREQEFLKLLSSINNPVKTRVILSLSSIILIVLTLACFFMISIPVFLIYNIPLSAVDYPGISNYFLAALLLVIFFYFIGQISGYIRWRPSIKNAVIALIWFVSVWIVPSAINLSIDQEFSKLDSEYHAELEKIKIVSSFEKEALKKHGKANSNNIENGRKVAEGFWEKERKEIAAVDEKQKQDLKTIIDRYKRLAIFFPTTFYQLTGNEVSSKGYIGFFKFFTIVQKMKQEFLRFWVDQVYYKEPMVVVPFIKEKEGHLFPSESTVPENFNTGVLVNFSYALLLFLISSYLFNRNICPLLKNRNACNKVVIELEKGKLYCMNDDFPEFVNQLINVFFGKIKAFKGVISINGVSIVSKKKKNSLYLSNVDHFPQDIKTKHLIKMFKIAMKLTGEEFTRLKASAGEANLNKPFDELKRTKKVEILLSLVGLGKSLVYILNDFGKGLTEKERNKLEELTKKWEKEDIVVIEIISTGSTPVCDSDEAVSIKIDKKGSYKAVRQ
jgi:hypothetical protein